ncbi:hypothetical protein AAGS40_18170 [Paraburkholderia sp. PREW-6R]|uniref:hypothetical protein n=1 Tax=Paraburkholderia sp. PREW-6R TaxID=3141544 RepID=UPI0031F59113
MMKFFDKALADEIGYGAATLVAAAAQELYTLHVEANAMRRAAGLPSFEEEEEAEQARLASASAASHQEDENSSTDDEDQ